MEIWALFSIVNDYDQPDSNLEAWWVNKPSDEQIMKAIGCELNDAVYVSEGYNKRIYDANYRLEKICDGIYKYNGGGR